MQCQMKKGNPVSPLDAVHPPPRGIWVAVLVAVALVGFQPEGPVTGDLAVVQLVDHGGFAETKLEAPVIVGSAAHVFADLADSRSETPSDVADSGFANFVVVAPADMSFVVLEVLVPADEKIEIPVVVEPGKAAVMTLEDKKHAGMEHAETEFACTVEMSAAVSSADL